MNKLIGKVAIVTGAAGGIGEATARLFLQEGGKVVATDLQYDKLNGWVSELVKEGLPIVACQHDTASQESWMAVVNAALAAYGAVHILVNNAGIYPAGATLINTTLQQWEHVMAVNLTGPFLGAQLCVQHMVAAGGGAIVNISSIAGMVGGNGPAYSASKGGLRLLTKDMAVELAPHGIRVNSIHPGGVLTPMTEGLVNMPSADELLKNMCPMQRIGRAEEIAAGALYLASDASSYATGTELVIDGGMIAR